MDQDFAFDLSDVQQATQEYHKFQVNTGESGFVLFMNAGSGKTCAAANVLDEHFNVPNGDFIIASTSKMIETNQLVRDIAREFCMKQSREQLMDEENVHLKQNYSDLQARLKELENQLKDTNNPKQVNKIQQAIGQVIESGTRSKKKGDKSQSSFVNLLKEIVKKRHGNKASRAGSFQFVKNRFTKHNRLLAAMAAYCDKEHFKQFGIETSDTNERNFKNADFAHIARPLFQPAWGSKTNLAKGPKHLLIIIDEAHKIDEYGPESRQLFFEFITKFQSSSDRRLSFIFLTATPDNLIYLCNVLNHTKASMASSVGAHSLTMIPELSIREYITMRSKPGDRPTFSLNKHKMSSLYRNLSGNIIFEDSTTNIDLYAQKVYSRIYAAYGLSMSQQLVSTEFFRRNERHVINITSMAAVKSALDTLTKVISHVHIFPSENRSIDKIKVLDPVQYRTVLSLYIGLRDRSSNAQENIEIMKIMYQTFFKEKLAEFKVLIETLRDIREDIEKCNEKMNRFKVLRERQQNVHQYMKDNIKGSEKRKEFIEFIVPRMNIITIEVDNFGLQDIADGILDIYNRSSVNKREDDTDDMIEKKFIDAMLGVTLYGFQNDDVIRKGILRVVYNVIISQTNDLMGTEAETVQQLKTLNDTWGIYQERLTNCNIPQVTLNSIIDSGNVDLLLRKKPDLLYLLDSSHEMNLGNFDKKCAYIRRHPQYSTIVSVKGDRLIYMDQATMIEKYVKDPTLLINSPWCNEVYLNTVGDNIGFVMKAYAPLVFYLYQNLLKLNRVKHCIYCHDNESAKLLTEILGLMISGDMDTMEDFRIYDLLTNTFSQQQFNATERKQGCCMVIDSASKEGISLYNVSFMHLMNPEDGTSFEQITSRCVRRKRSTGISKFNASTASCKSLNPHILTIYDYQLVSPQDSSQSLYVQFCDKHLNGKSLTYTKLCYEQYLNMMMYSIAESVAIAKNPDQLNYAYSWFGKIVGTFQGLPV